ncbi:MAG TPA: stage II sporulation protein R, partial [Firmicutes bacterium]|nr:stage II sporulation protein R [Bacillota bacterium]
MKDMRQTAFHPRLRRVGVILLAFVALVGIGLRATGANDQGGVAFRRGNLIRLHILANSDAAADQRVKLMVRDDLLREGEHLFRTVRSPREAGEIVRRNLGFFRRVAEQRLRAEGFTYPARVEYGVFPFPERTYGSLTLPAGQYTALRIVLGRGEG